MSGTTTLARRPESAPVAAAVGRILSCLAEAERIASGIDEGNAIATNASQPVIRRREKVRRMPLRGID
jgi:hypothetical protein